MPTNAPRAIEADLSAATIRAALQRDPGAVFRLAGLSRDPWQEDIMRAVFLEKAKRVALLASRQYGRKTTVTGGIAVVQALLYPGSSVFIGAPSEEQSKKVTRKAEQILRGIQLIGAEIEPDQVQVLRHRYKNGSLTEVRSSNLKTGRGDTAHVLIFTEAAFGIDDLIAALTPSLATTDGPLIFDSTAFGRRGRFYRVCDDSAPDHEKGWRVFQRKASECAHADPAFLRREWESDTTPGKWWYRQEYECEFVSEAGAVFDAMAIDGAVKDHIQPLFASNDPSPTLVDGPLLFS